jgi:hypothetical protein
VLSLPLLRASSAWVAVGIIWVIWVIWITLIPALLPLVVFVILILSLRVNGSRSREDCQNNHSGHVF